MRYIRYPLTDMIILCQYFFNSYIYILGQYCELPSKILDVLLGTVFIREHVHYLNPKQFDSPLHQFIIIINPCKN